MNAERVLALLLALSGALNVALAVGITARHAGAGHPDRRWRRRDRHGHLLRRSIRLPLTDLASRLGQRDPNPGRVQETGRHSGVDGSTGTPQQSRYP